MELGKGYAFVACQQRIHTEKQDYYIDLVFSDAQKAAELGAAAKARAQADYDRESNIAALERVFKKIAQKG